MNRQSSVVRIAPFKDQTLVPTGGGVARKTWHLYVLVVILYAVICRFAHVESVPDGAYAEAVVLAAIAMFPMAVWSGSREHGVPIFELICISYGVQYSLPVFLQPNIIGLNVGFVRLPWEATQQAEILTIAGLVSMIAAYYAVQRLAGRSRLPHVDLVLDSPSRNLYMIVALVIGTAALAIHGSGTGPTATSGLSAIFTLLIDQAYVALVLLAYLVYSGSRGVKWRAFLYISVALLFLLGLATSFLEDALIPVVLPLIAYWHVRGRLPMRWLLVGIVLFLSFNAVKHDYRTQAASETIGTGLTGRITTWLDLVANSLQNTAQNIPTGGGQALLSDSTARFDQLHIFSSVVLLTPSPVPFYGGKTYAYLPIAWIPRFAWPDKPDVRAVSGNPAVDYGLTLTPTTQVSIGLGQPGEAYANFGVAGVIFVLALQGMFFALLSLIFNRPSSDGARAIYLAVMVFFLNGIGTGTAILFGGVLQKFAASALILWLIIRFTRARTRTTVARSTALRSRHAGAPASNRQINDSSSPIPRATPDGHR